MSYEEFFHLKDAPFRLTPDPDYFFPSGVHKEALDTMIYSIRSGEGFVLITGTPGVGKTLLVRTLLRELGSSVNRALVLNPTISPRELLSVILDDLGVTIMVENREISKEMLLRCFREYLLDKSSQGIKTIIIIDEAQNLPRETLEELRILSNLESDKEKLLQIILVGQLELEERLQYDEMKQLTQRITIRYRLNPLSPEETGAYVRHRLEVAGGAMSVRFMPRVMGRIHALSSGIPRRINLICERALMAAYLDGEKSVSKKHLVRAIRSIEGNEDKISTFPGWLWSALGGSAVILAALWVALQYDSDGPAIKDVAQPPAVLQQKEVPGAAPPPVTKPEEDVVAARPIPAPPEPVKSPAGSSVDTGPSPEPIAKTDFQTNARVLPETPPVPVRESRPSMQVPPTPQFTPDVQEPVPGTPDLLVTSNLAPDAQKQLNVSSRQSSSLNSQPSAPSLQTSPAETAVLPLPPGELVQYPDEKAGPPLLPVNEFYLSVDRDSGLARLWLGGASGPVAKHQFPLDWRIMEGLYLLGVDREKGPFIFNPILFQWGGYNMLNAAAVWDQVDEFVADTLVPVVVHSSTKAGKDLPVGDITTIREIINNWSQAWRNRDINALMSFYARTFTTYSIDSYEPKTYSLAQLSDIRGRILGTSSYISLTTSIPIILVDPLNQDLAIAVFRQQYMSNIYSDKGIKVLYLRREDNYPEHPWKIVAKFFLPTG